MNSLTRRAVLMLAGLAVFMPFLGSVADDGAAKLPEKCKFVIKDNLKIWVNNKSYSADSTDVPIKYLPVDGDPKSLMFSLPWAGHHAIKCPKMSGDTMLTQHTFTFEIVTHGTTAEIKDGKAFHHVRITCEEKYGKDDKRGTVCVFMCDGHEVIIPAGSSFVCDGVEIPCSERGKP
jgi:hypothetical protein